MVKIVKISEIRLLYLLLIGFFLYPIAVKSTHSIFVEHHSHFHTLEGFHFHGYEKLCPIVEYKLLVSVTASSVTIQTSSLFPTVLYP